MARKAKFTAKIVARRKLRDVKALAKSSMGGKHHVKVGLPKGTQNPYSDGSEVIEVGIANEFGTETIPERSFLRSAIRENKAGYKTLNRKLLRKIREGKLTIEQALGQLGADAAADVAQKIDDIKSPPNAPSTIARKKGVDNPLVNEGHLKQAITYEVVKK